jgi:hypothetical protein
MGLKCILSKLLLICSSQINLMHALIGSVLVSERMALLTSLNLSWSKNPMAPQNLLKVVDRDVYNQR